MRSVNFEKTKKEECPNETHGMHTESQKRNTCISHRLSEIGRNISMCSNNYNNYACTIITVGKGGVTMPIITIRDIEDAYKDKQATQEWN